MPHIKLENTYVLVETIYLPKYFMVTFRGVGNKVGDANKENKKSQDIDRVRYSRVEIECALY